MPAGLKDKSAPPVGTVITSELTIAFVKEGGKGSGPRFPQARKLKSLESKAFDTMGLHANATSAEIKSRYKELVKKHHPDANGGDRGSEERFRAVIQAYQLLKQNGFC